MQVCDKLNSHYSIFLVSVMNNGAQPFPLTYGFLITFLMAYTASDQSSLSKTSIHVGSQIINLTSILIST